MATEPSEHLVKVIASVRDQNGDLLLDEADAVQVWVALRDAGYRLIREINEGPRRAAKWRCRVERRS